MEQDDDKAPRTGLNKAQASGLGHSEHDEAIIGETSWVPSVAYGGTGMRTLASSPYVLGAAILASLGGFSMGYDMGVISLINDMDQFHAKFPFSATDFGTEFMTAMLLLGAFVGCIFMPYMADRYSRKWAITVCVVIFDIGAIIQTAAPTYAALVVGRFIGGIGVGTLAMVTSLFATLVFTLLTEEPSTTRVLRFISPKYRLQTFAERCSCLSPYPSQAELLLLTGLRLEPCA